MAINDNLDENAPDFSDIQTQLPQANTPINPAHDTHRNASRAEIILAIAIMIGFIAIVYFLLQGHPTPKSYVGTPAQQ